jgi:hypothetical protein
VRGWQGARVARCEDGKVREWQSARVARCEGGEDKIKKLNSSRVY